MVCIWTSHSPALLPVGSELGINIWANESSHEGPMAPKVHGALLSNGPSMPDGSRRFMHITPPPPWSHPPRCPSHSRCGSTCVFAGRTALRTRTSKRSPRMFRVHLSSSSTMRGPHCPIRPKEGGPGHPVATPATGPSGSGSLRM